MCAAIWMVLDGIWIVAAAWLAHDLIAGASVAWSPWETKLVSIGAPAILLVLVLAGVYARQHRQNAGSSIARIVLTLVLAWACANRAALIANTYHLHLFTWLDLWSLCSVALMLLARLVCGEWIGRVERRRQSRRRVAVAGDAAYLGHWLQSTDRRAEGYVVTAVYVSNARQLPDCGVPAIKDFDALVARAKNQDFDELWLALPMSSQDEISRFVSALQQDFIDIRLFADVQKFPLFNPAATTLAGNTFIDLVTSRSSQEDAWSKSLFDRLFAALALLLLSPLLLLIAALVKCTSQGPVFFRQRRKGVDGREFTILKFRSMKVHKEAAGRITQASKNDLRITRVGRLLRRTSLDELPQFINVLLGQMSVVGPRPHALEHDDFYMRLIDGYMYRYRIKPGITGWAQVNGARGETTKVESMARRIALDLFYIQHWSFWLDLKIVGMTMFKGFIGKNAY